MGSKRMSAITDHGFRCASPAAIVVGTPAGSGNVKSRERLQVFYFAPSWRKKTAWGKTPPYGKMTGAAQIAEESPDFTSGASKRVGHRPTLQKNPRLTAWAMSNGAIHRTLLDWVPCRGLYKDTSLKYRKVAPDAIWG